MNSIIQDVISNFGHINEEKLLKHISYHHIFLDAELKERIETFLQIWSNPIPLRIYDLKNREHLHLSSSSFDELILSTPKGESQTFLNFIAHKPNIQAGQPYIYASADNLLTGLIPIVCKEKTIAYCSTGYVIEHDIEKDILQNHLKSYRLDPSELWLSYNALPRMNQEAFMCYLKQLQLFLNTQALLGFEQLKTTLLKESNGLIHSSMDKTNESFEILFDNTSDAVFVIRNNRIIRANRVAMNDILLGTLDSHPNFTDFLFPEDEQNIMTMIGNILRQNTPTTSELMRIRDRNNQVHYYETILMPLGRKQSIHHEIIIFFHHVTEAPTTTKETIGFLHDPVFGHAHTLLARFDSTGHLLSTTSNNNYFQVDPVNEIRSKFKFEDIIVKNADGFNATHLFYEAFITHELVRTSCFIKNNQGKSTYTEFIFSPNFDEQKNYTGLTLLAFNQERIKILEDKSKLGYEVNNEILKMFHLLIYHLDEKNRVTYTNDSTVSNHHINQFEHIIGKNILDIPDHFPPKLINKILHASQTNQSCEVRYTIQTINEISGQKNELWMRAQIIPQTANETYLGQIIISSEITKERELENRYKNLNSVYTSTFDHAPLVNIVTDLDGNFLYLNQKALKFLNLNTENFTHFSFYDFSNPETPKELEPFYKGLEKVKATLEPIQLISPVYFKDADQTRQVQAFIAPYTDKEDKMKGYFIQQYDITDAFLKNEHLIAADSKFQSYFNMSTYIIIIYDKAFNLNLLNQAAYTFLGIDPGHEKEYTIKDFIRNPDQQQIIESNFRSILETGQNLTFEFKLQTADFDFKWLRCYATPDRNPQGEIIGIMAQHIDITQYKQTETELLASHQLFYDLANMGFTQIYRTDKDLKLIFMNKPAEEFFNAKFEDFKGSDFSLLASDKETQKNIRRAQKNQELFDFQHQIVGHDGQKYWHQSTMIPNYTPEGTFDGYIIQCLDITKIKSYETKLLQKQEEYVALLNTGLTSVFQYDADLNLVYVNHNTLEFVGCTEAYFRSHSIFEFLHSSLSKSEIEHKFFRAIKEKKNQYIVLYVERKDKQMRWLNCTISPIFVDDKLQFVYIEANDITEIKEGEAKIKASERRFKNLANNGDMFIYQFDENNICTFVNDTALELMGLEEKQMLGYEADRIPYVNEIIKRYNTQFTTLFEKRNQHISFDVELQIAHNNKPSIWIQCSCAPMKNEEGDYSGVLIQALDISAIKATSLRLTNLENAFKHLTDEKHLYFAFLNENLEYDYMNEAFKALTHFKLNTALEKPSVFNILEGHEEKKLAFIDAWSLHILNHKSYSMICEVRHQQDHSHLIVRAYGHPIMKGTQFLGYYMYLVDLTEESKKLDNLKTQNYRLTELNHLDDSVSFYADENLVLEDISSNIVTLTNGLCSKEALIGKRFKDFKIKTQPSLKHILSTLETSEQGINQGFVWRDLSQHFYHTNIVIRRAIHPKTGKLYYVGKLTNDTQHFIQQSIIKQQRDIIKKFLYHPVNVPCKFDNEGHFTFIPAQYNEITTLPIETMMGKTLDAIFEVIDEALKQSLFSNDMELNAHRPKGIKPSFEASAIKELTPGQENYRYNEITNIQSYTLNNSYKQLVGKKEIVLQKNYQSLFFHSSTVAMFIIDDNFELIDWNNTTSQMVYPQKVFYRQNILTLFNSHTNFSGIKLRLAFFKNHPDTIHDFYQEVQLANDNYYLIHNQTIYKSNLGLYFVTWNDVTDREDIKKKYENLSNISEQILRTMREGAITVDSQYKIINHNDAAIRLMSQLSDANIMGQEVSRYFSQDINTLIDQAIEDDKPHEMSLSIELNMNVFHFHFNAFRIPIDHGSTHYVGLIIHDETEFEKIQHQLIRSERMVSLGEMATAMAHEINQPLLSISMSLDNLFLRLKKNNSDDQAYIDKKNQRIFSDIERIGHLIDHVRDFSRNDTTADSNYGKENFDLNTTANNALTIIGEQLTNHGFHIEKELAADLPELHGNPFQLEQVVLNFLSNARDAINERALREDNEYIEKKIKLKTYSLDDGLYLTVTDNGTGINQTIKEKILQPFFSTKGKKGVGIGLSISKEIMNNFNGEIRIDSDGANFTTMIAFIPCSEQANNKKQ